MVQKHMNYIKKIVLIVAVICGLAGLNVVAPTIAFSTSESTVSAAGVLKNAACSGLSQVDASQGCGSGSSSTITNIAKVAINILSLIVGIAAVIMIILSGFRFITSQGDASGIASARNALIYAIVGLVVVALAQVIVHFVLSKV